MANKYPPQSAFDWSDSWCDSDDGVQDVVKPGAGDVPIFTANSADCALNENSAALGGLTMTGYTGTLATGSNTIDVDGNAVLDGTITATAASLEVSGNLTLTTAMTALPDGLNCEMNGTGTLVSNGVSIGSFEVNTAGVLTSSANHTFTGDLILTSSLDGVSALSGTWTHAPATVSDIKWGDSSPSIPHIKLGSGGTSRLTGLVWANEITIGAGIEGAAVTQSGSQTLALSMFGDDKWNQTVSSGTVVINGIRFVPRNAPKSTGFLCGSSILGQVTIQDQFSVGAITMTDDWDLGATTLAINAFYNNALGELDTGTFNLICGDIELGLAPARIDGGVIDFGTGNHSIASITALNDDAGAQSAIDFASSFISLSGVLEGAGITETNTAGIVSSGTINNVNVSGSNDLTHIYPVGATGNTGVNALYPARWPGGI